MKIRISFHRSGGRVFCFKPFGVAEVEELEDAVGGDEDAAGVEIAMQDGLAAIVSLVKVLQARRNVEEPQRIKLSTWCLEVHLLQQNRQAPGDRFPQQVHDVIWCVPGGFVLDDVHVTQLTCVGVVRVGSGADGRLL